MKIPSKTRRDVSEHYTNSHSRMVQSVGLQPQCFKHRGTCCYVRASRAQRARLAMRLVAPSAAAAACCGVFELHCTQTLADQRHAAPRAMRPPAERRRRPCAGVVPVGVQAECTTLRLLGPTRSWTRERSRPHRDKF